MRRFLLIAVLTLATPVVSPAQTAQPNAAGVAAQQPSGPPATQAASLDPEIVSVVNLTRADKDFADAKKKATNSGSSPEQATAAAGKAEAEQRAQNQGAPGPEPAELKDLLRIEVPALEAWLKEKNTNTVGSLRLFLAGIELKNVAPVLAAKNPGALLVRLEPENDKEGVIRKAWVQVLQTAYHRPIEISVGVSGQAPFASKATLALRVYPDYTWLVLVFLGLVVLGIIVLGKFSNILRDANGATDPPYSLAKHQMAVWFVAVVGSYLYIWLITGFFASISTTALTLIGISGVTGLIAVTMDAGKRTDAAKARAALRTEHDALEKTLNDPATGLQAQLKAAAPGSPTATDLAAAVTAKQARLQELEAQLAVPVAQESQRWYLDLLSDENGISFNRLQMAIWTLVLVMVFIRAVYADILMPDFDTTLLGLMGISSGTYIGFKLPEKPS
jgi:hypothetical protein